jgi:hypothetical protein
MGSSRDVWWTDNPLGGGGGLRLEVKEIDTSKIWRGMGGKGFRGFALGDSSLYGFNLVE